MIQASSTSDLQIQILQSNIEQFEQRQHDTENLYQKLYDGSINSNNRLSDQIGWSSIEFTSILFIFTIIFGIVGFFYSRHINSLLNNIIEIKDEIEKFINENNNALLVKVRRELALSWLSRLENIPGDIENLFGMIATSDYGPSDFSTLLSAWNKFISDDSSLRSSYSKYALLFIQHFPAQSLRNESIRNNIIESMRENISGIYEHELRNFMDALFDYILERNKGNEFSIALCAPIFFELHSSKFNGFLNEFKSTMIAKGIDVPKLISELEKVHPANTTYISWLNS